jgi:hypothetical protein
MTQTQVVGFERLELRFSPKPWRFAQLRRAQIDAHFARLRARNPHLWNGRVLLLHDFALAPDVFHGDYLETDFASSGMARLGFSGSFRSQSLWDSGAGRELVAPFP